ncbi:hypothetical protein [Actinoplanes sp. HUAS TT8]|uniref:hypothetical protein n=1 Tax=Actinoplanes sp. HUAS TT8 TaxID=3447453 RepID=UPI003F520C31
MPAMVADCQTGVGRLVAEVLGAAVVLDDLVLASFVAGFADAVLPVAGAVTGCGPDLVGGDCHVRVVAAGDVVAAGGVLLEAVAMTSVGGSIGSEPVADKAGALGFEFAPAYAMVPIAARIPVNTTVVAARTAGPLCWR